jgi:tetratricopeptide (TPR) repeat protein
MKLYDWFLPALYQAGKDTPLLTDKEPEPVEPVHWGNLPALQEAGFFGRSRELWQVERAFVQGTRRITVSGFGGQGKTYLVQEAGRWLYRTRMFQKVCFVDYAAFQGVDAVALAVSTLATVLDKSLLDVSAASQALREQPTLLILDNLEALQLQPLRELLDVAKQWSEVGECRVLLTTRMLDFAHPDYPTEESLSHRSLPLGGLGREDALAYFHSLMKLPPAPLFDPPERNVLLELFKLVAFHPLSIGLLARQLKVRRLAELGQRLEALVAQTPDNPLLASLNLSLERLDDEVRQWLPRLGVFQGGAMEDVLLDITEFSEAQWQTLCPALEATGLIQPEYLPGITVPYLKFHPTLAPALWSRLSSEQEAELLARHRQEYYLLSAYLYDKDVPNPLQSRAIVRRELPNLLYAVKGALNAGEKWAVEFVARVNKFLDYFRLNRDRDALCQCAKQADGAVGSQSWYLVRSNLGEQLFSDGRYPEAAQVFNEILVGLSDQPSYELCWILSRLGRCLAEQAQVTQALGFYRQGLALVQQLEVSDGVKRLMATLLTDSADAFKDIGDYGTARIAYEQSLALAKEMGDARGEAVANGQLGTLALFQDNIAEAAQRYLKALTKFQQLKEPAEEAVFWHLLGMVYQKAEQWGAAEQAYREAARIRDLRNLAGAAQTWHNLAVLTKSTDKPEEAEAWFYKAFDKAKSAEDWLQVSNSLTSLADMLQNQPNRLSQARQLAEEALAIKQTLDPAAAKIWNTYGILAEIADKQHDTTKAKEYRRLSREAKAAFVGTKYELHKHEQLIYAVVAAVNDAEVRRQLEPHLQEGVKNGWGNLVAAIHRLLEGERDVDVPCEELAHLESSMIIYAILRGIAEPETLKPLLEGQED